MKFSKETMWVDSDPSSDNELMTSAEVRENYISEYESFCGYSVRELWDDVVMSDEEPSRHHTQLLDEWLKNTTLLATDDKEWVDVPMQPVDFDTLIMSKVNNV